MLTKAPSTELQDTPHIDGRCLRYLSARKRGELAIDLIERGHYAKAVAATACGVSLSTVYRIYRELVPQAPKPSPAYVAHADWWSSAPFRDRVAFCRECGVGEVWDALSTAVS
jgi:hypothetical protein